MRSMNCGGWYVSLVIIVMGWAGYASGETGGHNTVQDWENFMTYSSPPNDSVLIVAFGNSITAVRNTVDQVFAQRLPGLLAREGVKASVINSGIGGSHTGRRADHDLFKIRHGMDRFQSDVLDHQPDLVIKIGRASCREREKLCARPSRSHR